MAFALKCAWKRRGILVADQPAINLSTFFHKPFDFLSSIYPFYMFYTAKTFSVHRRVRNHYSKRILNLILNRKKFLRRGNDPLGNLIRGKTAADGLLRKATVLQRLSRSEAVPTKEVDW